MDDPPDPNEATKQLAAAVGALVIVLIDKGIITQQEYDRAYIQAQHDVSQEFARKRDEKHVPGQDDHLRYEQRQ